MARDKGRMDLKKDIRDALDLSCGYYVPELTVDAVLAAVLPHFELAYERGVIAERSRAGYKIPNQRKESE